jgi:hypothetical protein
VLNAWKMDDLFQRPLWPISIILNFLIFFKKKIHSVIQKN